MKQFTKKHSIELMDVGYTKLNLLNEAEISTIIDDCESLYKIYDNNLDKLGFNLVKRYDGVKDYTLLKDMIKDNEEGFVVRFFNGDRVKIKGDEYIRLHKIMTNLSTTGVWEVLSSGGEMDDLIKDVPDEFYNKIKDYVKELRYQYHSVNEHAGKLFDGLYESYDRELPENNIS